MRTSTPPGAQRPQAFAYVSDFEQFMEDFLARHPEVEEDQRRGWYIWWDRPTDRNGLAHLRESEVPFKPYA
ncbi:DUF3460 family protein [Massilia sp. PAMC28688]|nr:DUF3460 family protein [Massilia sp. PAMC28688]